MRFGILLIALVGCTPISEVDLKDVSDANKQAVETAALNNPFDTHPGPLICPDTVMNDQSRSGFGLQVTNFQPCYPMYDRPSEVRRQELATEQAVEAKGMQKANEPPLTEAMLDNPDHVQTVIARESETKQQKTSRPRSQTARR